MQLREVCDKWCNPTMKPHSQALRLGSNDPSPDRFCSESPKTAMERNYDTTHTHPVPAGAPKKLHFRNTTRKLHAAGPCANCDLRLGIQAVDCFNWPPTKSQVVAVTWTGCMNPNATHASRVCESCESRKRGPPRWLKRNWSAVHGAYRLLGHPDTHEDPEMGH